MQSKLLSEINAHPRDSAVEFDEPTHVYTIAGEKGYTSVTTWIHHFFPKFDADLVISKMRKGRNWGPDNQWYGMSDAEIKSAWNDNGANASSLGTKMHLNIENWYNGLPVESEFKSTREWELFSAYLEDHKDYKAYRTEWSVYSKAHKLAGSIDMIYQDPKDPGKIVIADWKRAKEIKFTNPWETGLPPITDLPNCNYIHYTLQLNVYRMILEKYYGQCVSEMFLVILHPDQDTYLKIPIQKMSKPILAMLATSHKNN